MYVMNHPQFCASEYGNINMNDGFNNPNLSMYEVER